VRFIEPRSKRFGPLTALALLSACSTPLPSATPPRPGPPAAGAVALAHPGAARNWHDLRMQAARRMVAANPNGTYTDSVPDVLLAIPVLEIELNRDGSVRRINVLRKPGQASDTLELAIDAVRRAAPYGDVSRLPKPWKFTETFLFNDDRKFKPRTLD
jgi:hypothetical protein